MFFKKLKIWKRFFSTKNAILLILTIDEFSPGPELSSPTRFKIQGGGYAERYGEFQTEKYGRRGTEILVSNLG